MTTPRTPAPGSTLPTQVAYPRRATIRSAFQGFVAGCALVPATVAAIDSVPGIDLQHGPAWAVGGVAAITATAAAVTRVMAIPGVNDWIARYAPVLAPEPKAPVDAAAIITRATGGEH